MGGNARWLAEWMTSKFEVGGERFRGEKLLQGRKVRSSRWFPTYQKYFFDAASNLEILFFEVELGLFRVTTFKYYFFEAAAFLRFIFCSTILWAAAAKRTYSHCFASKRTDKKIYFTVGSCLEKVLRGRKNDNFTDLKVSSGTFFGRRKKLNLTKTGVGWISPWNKVGRLLILYI